MPTDVTIYLVGVWFVVGLVTGAGWTLGAVIITRLTTR
jgi:hypothetical protein